MSSDISDGFEDRKAGAPRIVICLAGVGEAPDPVGLTGFCSQAGELTIHIGNGQPLSPASIWQE